LLGHLREEGFMGYYLAAFMFKTPLAIVLMLILTGVHYLRGFRWQKFLDDEWFLLAPVLIFSIYFNFFYKTQIGIRYYLVVYPFLLVFTSSLLVNWRRFTTVQWGGVFALSLYLLISSLSYYPHYIPYFNELVSDRRMAYKILADSNLDWGQANHYLRRYWEEHPEIIIEPDGPTAGKIVVSANDVVGITAKPPTYAWLRDNFEPVDTIAYAILVYDLTEGQIQAISNP
jgi:energy-coupling factor transporter transmembrane protein EcfT